MVHISNDYLCIVLLSWTPLECCLFLGNLAKRNWRDSKNCSFYSLYETIHHLFFKCAYARFLCTDVHMLFGIPRPIDINNLFDHWPKRERVLNTIQVY